MNKGAHISLAIYLMQHLKGLNMHKKAFLIGSILPDCRPSFLTTRHTISETYELLLTEIKAVTEYYDKDGDVSVYYSVHLGIIMHFLADYFTFPHNLGYHGNVKTHIEYEKELTEALRQQMQVADLDREIQRTFGTMEEMSDYIMELHGKYVEEDHSTETDSRYIIKVCYTIAEAVLKQKGTVQITKKTEEIEAA